MTASIYDRYFSGKERGTNGNKSFHSGEFYSYALCICTKIGDRYLINGQKSTPTTMRHISSLINEMRRRALDYTIVSYSALQQAGVSIHHIAEKVSILDTQIDTRTDLFYNRVLSKYYNEDGSPNYLKYGMVERMKPAESYCFAFDSLLAIDSTIENWNWGWLHQAGGCLLEIEGNQYVGTIDEGRYCLIQIKGKFDNYMDAIDSLKPSWVKAYEKLGATVIRQGEWYFCKTELSDDKLEAMFHVTSLKKVVSKRKMFLPIDDSSSNLHCPTEMIVPVGEYEEGYISDKALIAKKLYDNYRIFVRGKVYHRRRNFKTETGDLYKDTVLSGEHASLNLGDTWHEVFKNTEVQSWTVQGRFD